DDALEALFKFAESKGQTIPDDVKDAIRKDPKLRDAITNAAKTGNSSDAQREAGERIARMIAEHSDELTEEEMESLLQATEGAKGSIPDGDVTVEQMKRVIEAKKRNAQGGGSGAGADGGGAGPGKDATGGPVQGDTTDQPGAAPTPSGGPLTPEERLVEGMA